MSELYDIAIVGGGPAGLTAGIYGARAGKRVLIFERESIGGQISRASLVENYPGIKEISGIDLSASLFEQAVSNLVNHLMRIHSLARFPLCTGIGAHLIRFLKYPMDISWSYLED